MPGRDAVRTWLPVIATGVGFVLVVGGAALLASTTVADLLGLIYLLASPAIYRGFRALAEAETAIADPATGTAG